MPDCGCDGLRTVHNTEYDRVSVEQRFKENAVSIYNNRMFIITKSKLRIQSREHSFLHVFLFPDPQRNAKYSFKTVPNAFPHPKEGRHSQKKTRFVLQLHRHRHHAILYDTHSLHPVFWPPCSVVKISPFILKLFNHTNATTLSVLHRHECSPDTVHIQKAEKYIQSTVLHGT